MSTKNNGKKATPEFETIVSTQEESLVQVIWRDETGNTIVGGQKMVKGNANAAQKQASKFADDLKKNNIKKFPVAEPDPEEMEGEL